jgi:hypothetical protein
VDFLKAKRLIMGRFGNSWRVFKESFAVLKKDKELVLLPIISFLASAAVVASIAFPAYTTGFLQTVMDSEDPAVRASGWAALFVVYVILTFISVYFMAGIMYAANIRLSGGDPTLGQALKGPSKQLGKIFLWALFAATVAVLLRALEAALRDRVGSLGAFIFGSLAGAAWWMATYFALPVVLFEKTSVIKSLPRSTSLFRKRWGEGLIGEFGLGAVTMLLTALAIPIAFVGFLLGGPFIVVGLVLAGIWVLIMAAVSPALSAIYKTALYRFAVEGEEVPYFSRGVIEGAWHPKGQAAPTFQRY